MSFLVLVVSQKVLYHRKGKGVQMCINTHCTPFKITKYYTTIKVKARVQPLKKLKSHKMYAKADRCVSFFDCFFLFILLTNM